jgi:WD40 repeat protein
LNEAEAVVNDRRALFLVLICFGLGPAARADDAPKPVSFREQVAPILVRKCLGCHNEKKASGGYSMATFALIKKGGKMAADLVLEPGDPEASYLIESVKPGASPRMPYELPPLGDAEIRTLEEWVRQGARFDGGSETATPIASLVDPLRDLPRVVLKAPVADAVTSVAFAPDGKSLAAAVGRSVLVFDAEGEGKPVTLDDHPGPLSAVRFTPDGKTIVAAGGRAGIFGAVTLWDVKERRKVREFRGPRDEILAAEVAPDGLTLATAGYDRAVILWDLETGRERRKFLDHTDAVYALTFSPDGKTLASAGADRTVKLWSVDSGERLATLSDATAELYAVAFSADGATVFAGGVDRSIRAWRWREPETPLAGSAFAHEAALLRLAVSHDGKTLVSSGEDRGVTVWDPGTLRPRLALPAQPDWPQAVALSHDGGRLAVGRFDGSLALYDARSGRLTRTPRSAPESSKDAKPALVRNASLNPPSPRGATRGKTVRLTLSGNGVGGATSVVFTEPGFDATLIPAQKPDPNRLDVDLAVAANARVGLHRFTLTTPLGVPAHQTFSVEPHPGVGGTEPDDDPAKVKPTPLPFTATGTIDRPGDVDHFRFEARTGQQLVFRTRAKALGSSLLAVLALTDDQGKTFAESSVDEGTKDPVLLAAIPRDGVYTLRVSDADYGGSGNHFYRVIAGADPYVTSVFPLGIPRGQTTEVRVEGANLQGSGSVPMSVPADAEPGALRQVPVRGAGGDTPDELRPVVVADGPQAVEAEPNDDPRRAGTAAVPGGASGTIGREGDTDLYRFEARKGERLILEVFGRRLGTPIDPVIDILDGDGRPVPRAVLRPVTETEVAFRDHNATTPGIRLTHWNNLALHDTVLIGRELTRIAALPRNPDDDCQFWSEQGQRAGLLETTPEHHPMGQAVSKVEIHPPGATFPPGGAPVVTLHYRNDDGGPAFGKDSRLIFDPPADGTYLVRVADVRGLGGERYGYHLVVRRPRPDFRLALSAENPSVPRGGTVLVTARLTRIDGFEGPVEVSAGNLPPGVTSSPALIEPGELSAQLSLSADPSAPSFSPPGWTVTAIGASSGGNPSGSPGAEIRHEIDPGGPSGGWVTVTPAANLAVTAAPARVVIRPGGEVTVKLSVARGPAFAGRVPIEVRNLPVGVRVLNVGLNGVLVTEAQTERSFRLAAEPWVGPAERPFYAVGKAESAGTEHSSPPVTLVVEPAATAAVAPGGQH